MSEHEQPRSTIRCPNCGHESAESVPVDTCLIVYDCTGCGAVLRPRRGDCCVFCSWGTAPCPTAATRKPEH